MPHRSDAGKVSGAAEQNVFQHLSTAPGIITLASIEPCREVWMLRRGYPLPIPRDIL